MSGDNPGDTGWGDLTFGSGDVWAYSDQWDDFYTVPTTAGGDYSLEQLWDGMNGVLDRAVDFFKFDKEFEFRKWQAETGNPATPGVTDNADDIGIGGIDLGGEIAGIPTKTLLVGAGVVLGAYLLIRAVK